MFLHFLNAAGDTVFSRNLTTDRQRFLRALEPFRSDIVVGCECMHSWYWLSDLCAEHSIPFVPGHAFGIKAIHADKLKSDARCSNHRYADAGGNFPLAYNYPKERRGLRDLLRSRLRLVRLRADFYK
jgi:hypothetical protein